MISYLLKSHGIKKRKMWTVMIAYVIESDRIKKRKLFSVMIGYVLNCDGNKKRNREGSRVLVLEKETFLFRFQKLCIAFQKTLIVNRID